MKKLNPALSFKAIGSGLVLIVLGYAFLREGVFDAERPWPPIVWFGLVFSGGLIAAGLALAMAGFSTVSESLALAELQMLMDKLPEGYSAQVRAVGERLNRGGGLVRMERVHQAFLKANASPSGLRLARQVAELWQGIGGWIGPASATAPTSGDQEARLAPPASVGDEAAIAAELIRIYQTHPQGFVRPDAAAAFPREAQSVSGPPDQAARIRAFGEALNSRGGMTAMLQMHAEFARRVAEIPGAARNLEIMWDGIGQWRG